MVLKRDLFIEYRGRNYEATSTYWVIFSIHCEGGVKVGSIPILPSLNKQKNIP